jgi:hypothetical protein
MSIDVPDKTVESFTHLALLSILLLVLLEPTLRLLGDMKGSACCEPDSTAIAQHEH